MRFASEKEGTDLRRGYMHSYFMIGFHLLDLINCRTKPVTEQFYGCYYRSSNEKNTIKSRKKIFELET